ncbi:MAG: thiamine phosphate synthase [Pseudomonadota bacterium]
MGDNVHPIAPTKPDVFYPIVPDIDWLKRIVPLGVRTVQLRLKNASASEIDRQIAEGMSACAEHDCQFIVNDYWQAAIKHGATDLHLGQEDLATADLDAIRQAGIKLGISTHTEAELEIALAAQPDSIALGPIYETKLKAMPYGTQGLDRITEWKQRIGAMPLIAIGGMTPERATQAASHGADTVSVITDFLTAEDPEARVAEWVNWAKLHRKPSQ